MAGAGFDMRQIYLGAGRLDGACAGAPSRRGNAVAL